MQRPILVYLPLISALCACHDDVTQQPSRTLTSAGSSQSLAEPFDRSFIGKAWVETSAGPDRGSIIVFLPDRTVLLADCPGRVRISTWGVAGKHIRWVEDTIPIEAEVVTPNKNELRLRVIGANRPQSYVLASPPYVCPTTQ
jgi:hypothetical protein